jgi:uncharacterized protein YdhG (YjbR/CyaY superfamily)
MQSKAKTVDEFLKSQPKAIRADLVKLRALVRAEAPDAVESMKYGMPVYSPAHGIDGQPMLCGFNAQKNYLAFYVGRVPESFRKRMRSFDVGKGCVRFKELDAEKAEVLQALLREVVAKKITCS